MAIVRFSGGEIGSRAVEQFRFGVMRRIRDHRCELLVVDLQGITQISSSLLGLLLQIHKTVSRIRLYNVSPAVHDVLTITRLVEMFEICASRA